MRNVCVCVSMISGFCCKADENRTHLGYYAVSCGNFLLMFQDNLFISSLGFKNPEWFLNPEDGTNNLFWNVGNKLPNLLRNNPEEHSSQCVCGVAHNQYSLSQQSRSLVANSLRESTYCALTRTSIVCCTTMCRVNQNGPTLVQKDNCQFFFCGVGGVKQENWETSIISILPDIDSYISWWISIGCVPFTQDKQITDHTSSFKQIFSIVLAFNWCWEKPFICTSEQAFHLGSR